MLILGENGRFSGDCTLILGGFDGLHLGHRALLREAKKTGFPLALTTIFGGKEGELFTKREREFLFEKAGISVLWEIDFTEEVKNTSAEEFCEEIFKRFHPRAIVCGEDFRFGKGALGTPELLKTYAPCLISVQDVGNFHNVPLGANVGACKFSVSDCKKRLGAGELGRLNACLVFEDFFSEAYFVQGVVEHGREVGRTYGFPTLNLGVDPNKLLPPDGVYAGVCATPKGNFKTIVNFGSRPTFHVPERKIEAHLLDFEGDLYGAEVRVYPTEFLRPIRCFSSVEELERQLKTDRESIREGEKA